MNLNYAFLPFVCDCLIMSEEKKRKLEKDVAAQLVKKDDDDESGMFNLFRIVRILNENPQQKTIYVHGKFDGQDGEALVILEKSPFNEGILQKLFEDGTQVKLTLNNDIYKTFEMYTKPELNGSNLFSPNY